MTWEERWHPLRKEWIVVAAHRQNRPWLGEAVDAGAPSDAHDPSCYLCPRNPRISGARNPDYDGIFTFDNDHPCVGERAPELQPSPSPVFRSRRADGVARVVCYHPRHDLTLAELPLERVVLLLSELQKQYRELSAIPGVNHVLMFENKGEVVGVSNPHPHGQIYATNFVFRTIQIEIEAAIDHYREHGRALFQDVILAEQQDGRRILDENSSALSFVPYFARYAYETYVAPTRSVPSLADLRDSELLDFAEVLRKNLVRFDNLWKTSFPYVMALHQAPTDGGDYRAFHFHIELHPPLRKPGLLKYLAGPEIGGGNFLSDTAPEQKAAELRQLSTEHYRSNRTGE